MSLLTGLSSLEDLGVVGRGSRRGVAGERPEEDQRFDSVFGRARVAGVEEIGLARDGVDVEARSSATCKVSKSHTTPCFSQLPHRG